MRAYSAILKSTESPWLLRTAIDHSELERELDRLKVTSEFATCVLDGRKMNTVDGVFEEFARGLEFPEYFGFNSPAFRDCLTDLAWLDPRGICILILAAEKLLKDESGELGWLLKLLEDACNAWSIAVEKGELWDRPAIPCHVLFHAANGSEELLPPELLALPCLEQRPPSAGTVVG